MTRVYRDARTGAPIAPPARPVPAGPIDRALCGTALLAITLLLTAGWLTLVVTPA